MFVSILYVLDCIHLHRFANSSSWTPEYWCADTGRASSGTTLLVAVLHESQWV